MKSVIKKWFDILEYDADLLPLLFSSYDVFDLAKIESNDNPYAWLNEQEDKNLCLLYALCKCEDFFITNTQKGIPEQILIDTMREVKRHTRKYTENGQEKLGIFTIKWIGTVLSGRLFCLERLEFEMKEAKDDISEYNVNKGDPVLNVHIPRTNTPIDKESVDRSFESAASFFPAFFKNFEYKGFTCHSWLMDPTLRTLLPPSSNIVMFLDRFDIVSSKESDSALKLVFDKNATYENINTYKAKTSLQKAVIDHVSGGGRMLMGFGYRPR